MNHAVTVGVVSAAAQQLAQEVFKVMLLQKLKLASATLLMAGLIAWGASAALVSLGQEAPKGAVVPPAPAVRPRADTAVPQPKPGSDDTAGTFPVRGRVLDPDGKPVAGAASPRLAALLGRRDGTTSDPVTHGQRGRVAVSGRGRPVPFRARQVARATSLTRTTRSGTRRRSRPSPRVTGRPGSLPDRC